MTTVTFRGAAGRLTGFAVEGHSGYAPAGSDIVCAAISAAVGLTECTINDVLGLAAPVRVRERDASITLRLPGGLSEESDDTCQALLTGMMVYLRALAEEYPDNLIVLLDDGDGA